MFRSFFKWLLGESFSHSELERDALYEAGGHMSDPKDRRDERIPIGPQDV